MRINLLLPCIMLIGGDGRVVVNEDRLGAYVTNCMLHGLNTSMAPLLLVMVEAFVSWTWRVSQAGPFLLLILRPLLLL